MSTSKKSKNTVEMTISGHQVSLTFAPEQNPAIAQQIIDAYIRQHGSSGEPGTETHSKKQWIFSAGYGTI